MFRSETYLLNLKANLDFSKQSQNFVQLHWVAVAAAFVAGDVD